ncbi:MAG: hypothetical protein WD230_03005 [Cucumibacter sp.]
MTEATPRFAVDKLIKRKERGRIKVGGKIIEVLPSHEERIYKIAYDEGGEGYWPESALLDA